MDIKEVVSLAREAQRDYRAHFDQDAADQVIKALCRVVYGNAEMLAREAIDETEVGVYEDKVAKCRNKSKSVWNDLQGRKNMGVLDIGEKTGLIRIAKPVGVVATITPTTNPIIIPMADIAFTLKTRNTIIVSPHPHSKNCSAHTIQFILEHLKEFNVPENLIQCVTEPSIQAAQDLMAAVDAIIATGDIGMIHSAYSSGKPSFGVGVSNVQVVLDEHINYSGTAETIIRGRTLDNGITCSDRQCFIYPEQHKEEIFQAFKDHGAYFVPTEKHDKMVGTLFVNGTISRDVVGKSVKHIAQLADISIPEGIHMLVMPAKGVGTADPICKEKMCPVMTYLPYKHFDGAIELANTSLKVEGSGYTAGIHSSNQSNITKAGDEITISCLIVNAPYSVTAGGSIQSGLSATTTLGCDSQGDNSISENLTYKHLLNISRIARMPPHAHVPIDEEIWTMSQIRTSIDYPCSP